MSKKKENPLVNHYATHTDDFFPFVYKEKAVLYSSPYSLSFTEYTLFWTKKYSLSEDSQVCNNLIQWVWDA